MHFHLARSRSEGTHAGKTTRDNELLLIKEQMEYNERVSLIQRLVAEAEGTVPDNTLKFEMEKTKQSENEAKKADAEARKAEAEVIVAQEACKLSTLKTLHDCRDKLTPEMLHMLLSSVIGK
jgi:membrane protein involved in colicin uptake